MSEPYGPDVAAPAPGIRPLASWIVAGSLLVTNGVLLAGNVIHVRANDAGRTGGPFSSRGWAGNLDGSFSELFGHAQLIVSVVLLVTAWRRRRAAVYGVWALVLGVVVADDFLRLHERLGAALVRTFDLPAVTGLRPQDLGELVVWAVPMLALGPALLVTHVRARGQARRHSWTLIVLTIALVGFAIVVDLAAYAVDSWIPELAGRALTLIETVGELGVMTLLLIAVYLMTVPRATKET